MIRWRLGLSFVLSAASVLLFVPSAGASEVPGREPARPVASGAPASGIEAAGNRVNRLSEALGALGAYYDSSTGEFAVVVPSSGPGSGVSAADFGAANAAVRVERRAITRAAVNAIERSVERRSWHPEAARYAYGTHLDLRRGVVVLETSAPSDVMEALVREYPGLLDYRQVATDRLTRQNDPAPHWGGASITDGTSTCTSGFSVQDSSSTRFMVTAAHCFAMGAAVNSSGGGGSFGRVTSRGPFPTWDLELLGTATYGSFIYRGGAAGTPSHVIGAGDPVVGFTGYCYSGQTTFENCGQTVTSLNGEYCDASGCTPVAVVFSGGGVGQGGDSGAPFYLPSGGDSYIRGMLFARSGTTMYAESWSVVAGHFNVSIVT